MKQFTHNITPKKGNYLVGAIIFGIASISALFITPSEIAPICAGFFGIFFLLNIILLLAPSSMGAQISSENTLTSSERLKELTDLHSKGFLTDEEFQAKRQSIINDI